MLFSHQNLRRDRRLFPEWNDGTGIFQLCNLMNKCGNVLDYVYASEPFSIQVIRAPSSLTASAENSANDERLHYPLEWELQFEERNQCSSRNNSMIKCFKKGNFDRINKIWSNFDLSLITAAPTIDFSSNQSSLLVRP